MNRQTIVLLVTLVAVLVASGSLSHLLSSDAARSTGEPLVAMLASGSGEVRPPMMLAFQQQPPPGSLFSELFKPDSPGLTPSEHPNWLVTTGRIAFRFLLATLLGALLAFRRRRPEAVTQRNPFVAQTQILLSLVAAAMMMIVGDSAARAFGIFAAASLVRFRTNIRDPKETTVLLICLAVGLASGVGRWDMAVIFTLFVLVTLWILEHYEQAQVFRSMEVTVVTRNADTTNEALKKIFDRQGFLAELRQLNRPDEEDPMGKIVYLVNLGQKVSTDRLSEEILAADRENIDSVEWDQKKSTTYIYR